MRCMHGLVLLLLCASVSIGKAAETSDSDDPPPPVGVPVNLLRELAEQRREEKGPTISKDGTHVDGKSVAEWIKQSHFGKAEERKAAFGALFVLGRKSNKEAVRGLIAGLADPNAKVTDYVYQGLENRDDFGNEELIPFLAVGLEATQPLKVRRNVAGLFAGVPGRFERTAAIVVLCAALKDEDALVRVKTAATLWHWDPNAADLVPIFLDGMEDADSDVKYTAFHGLESMGPSAAAAVSLLGEKMRNEDAQIGLAKVLLIGIGKAAVPTLILGLGSESKMVRAETANALERIGSDAADAVPALYGALRDEDLGVRVSGAQALWSIEHKASAVLPIFIDGYQHGKLSERLRAVYFFEETWPQLPEALACYASAMRDPDADVRSEAIDGRSRVSPMPDVLIQALVRSLKDPEEAVVNSAAKRLSEMQEEAFPYLPAICRDGPPRARAAAVKLLVTDAEHQQEVAALCLHALREDADVFVRRAAVTKLGECGEVKEQALAELLLALKDQDAGVRAAAARVLKFFERDGDAIAAAFIECLRDPGEEVRKEAARGLGHLRRRAKDAVPALIGALKDSSEIVQREAGIALSRFGPEAKAAIPHLAARLTNVSLLPRSSRKFGGESAEEPEEWAARTLSNIGVEAVPALAEALTQEKARVRIQAALALERIGPEAKAAIPQLKKLLSDPHKGVRKQAIDALKAIDPELAKKLLVS